MYIKVFSILFMLLLIVGGVFAVDVTSSESSETTQLVNESNQSIGPAVKSPMKIGSNLDFGMPFSSFADPEYVAQQKFMEGMTAVYMWIYANSGEVIQKCTDNKEELVSKIGTIITEAQETSEVCKKFESQAQECNPEAFCKNFQKGKLPLPPEAKIILKKMGKDPAKLTLSDLTEDLMVNVCKAQINLEVENKKAYTEKTKASIKSQISNFRTKCDELKKWKENMQGNEIKLPDFYIPKMEIKKDIKQDYKEQDYKNTKEEWKQPIQNEDNQQKEKQDEKQESQEPVESQDIKQPEVTEPENTESEQDSGQEQESGAEQDSGQEQESESESEATSAEASSSIISKTNVGLFGLGMDNVQQSQKAICGNNYCEPDLGENPENCHDDCLPGDFYKSSVVGPSNGGGMSQQQSVQTSASQGPNQGPGGQGNQGGPGFGNPEMMCELTDDEIIELYSDMMGSNDFEEEADYKCKTQSSNMMGGINMMKLEGAKCLANAALNCTSTKKLVENCNSVQSNPENVARFMANNLCRQFGIKPVDHDLYKLADKWLSIDPALAYEFGATVDNTLTDQNNLGFFSYVFGDNDYADNMKERADKLKAIKQRIVDANAEDPETMKVLEEQTQKLDDEANKFGNFFNFSRMFGG